jgi:hypothetical protein
LFQVFDASDKAWWDTFLTRLRERCLRLADLEDHPRALECDRLFPRSVEERRCERQQVTDQVEEAELNQTENAVLGLVDEDTPVISYTGFSRTQVRYIDGYYIKDYGGCYICDVVCFQRFLMRNVGARLQYSLL